MKLLVTAHYLPMPDRQAAMLRFFRLLAIIAPIHEIHFFAYSVGEQRTQIGQSVLDGYEAALRDLGIEVSHSETHNEGWPMFHDILREHKFDAVLFEHYLCAEPHIEPVRLLQPHARVVIDSIDLNFTRLF